MEILLSECTFMNNHNEWKSINYFSHVQIHQIIILYEVGHMAYLKLLGAKWVFLGEELKDLILPRGNFVDDEGNCFSILRVPNELGIRQIEMDTARAGIMITKYETCLISFNFD